MSIGTATGPPRQGSKRPEGQEKIEGESVALWCSLTTRSAYERRMHAKGKDKGRLSREAEDEILFLPLAEVERGKVEETYMEEEE